jgi:hypothetical protein
VVHDTRVHHARNTGAARRSKSKRECTTLVHSINPQALHSEAHALGGEDLNDKTLSGTHSPRDQVAKCSAVRDRKKC